MNHDIQIISLEELQEREYNLEYNPFDTTGTGYLNEDFTEDMIAQNEQAIEYHYQNQNKSCANPKVLFI